MRKHLRCETVKVLSELSLESIFEVQAEFKKLHPDDYLNYSNLFDVAISRKYEELSMQEIITLVEMQKNAPSSATNTGQGNEPDNHD